VEEQFDVLRGFDDDASRVELMKHDVIFHDTVLRAAGNDRIAATVRSLRDAVVTRHSLTSRPITAIVDEHEPLLSALREHNSQKARTAIYHHIASTWAYIVPGERQRESRRAP
jgi:DNA-binding GntR family transcriptional regulator